MALKSGYLVPDVQPEGMTCVKLFIPSDDLYLYALGGAFQYFTKWVAWERGGTRAIEAAEKWLAAYDYTMEHGWLNCGEDEEVTTINFSPIINVDVGGSSSSSGCSSPPPWDGEPGQCYPIQDPPDQSGLPVTPPLPPPEVPPEEWDEYRCKVANYGWELVDSWLLRVSTGSTYLGTLAFILFFLWSIIPAALAAFVGGALLELASSIVAWSAYLEALDEYFERALQWWRDNREDLVCRFYNATNAESLREGIVGELVTAVVAGMESRPDWFDQMGDFIERTSRFLLPLRLFTFPWSLVPPVGYVSPIDCSCDETGGTGVPILIDEGWWLIPVPQDSFGGTMMAVPNADTGSVTYAVNTFTMHPLTAESFHEVDLDLEALSELIGDMQVNYGDIVGGTIASLHGHVVDFLTTYGNFSDGFQFSGSTGGAVSFQANAGQRCISHNSSLMAGGGGANPAYYGFIATADVTLPYGNTEMNTGKAEFRLQTYGSTAPAFVSVKLWYIARVE